ncbi:bifunctional pyr operon transcriptional regulator/uracil phosphoribosyltransferase [Ventosimonas gracilis]|uniref:Bifunctional pyr operon transcriptional regulator/uracil phosphoribosyltransferase n=1 Tax=Ventosimonas gracilis TaxID=1680762 RepID=A0A139SUK9_9GAMM|nr:bifunctional pyr operon transcriptional regulator/uracil phosphoribosyltransferase PyrR [Ventosimonas gracilis]KXU38279.1 bifunctional pyr operon transcriptional regulator/uracil phosphoribosyltransferase [Ventosimonas gracilis]
MNLPQPAELLPEMAATLREHLRRKPINQPQFVGIHTGGVWIAKALLRELKQEAAPFGVLDASFYRDDFEHSGLHPQIRPSALPFAVDGADLVLVDDVLMSGRTIRAALNELFDYGRPASVTLVCLLDLNARELPIRADVTGAALSLPEGTRVKLSGPAPLILELRDSR